VRQFADLSTVCLKLTDACVLKRGGFRHYGVNVFLADLRLTSQLRQFLLNRSIVLSRLRASDQSCPCWRKND
jgi:hypothetical protein